MIFNPFENRLCRDIRNHLGHAFVLAIQAKDVRLFKKLADQYQPDTQSAQVRDYIRHREACLGIIYKEIDSGCINPEDKVTVSILLWNLELFFEFHEWLEIEWKSAFGRNKKAFQALILLAVTYEQLLYGRKLPAKKAATKALLLIKEYGAALPKGLDKDLLIRKLSVPDPVPPKFSLLV
jgi:uncharacterized protein